MEVGRSSPVGQLAPPLLCVSLLLGGVACSGEGTSGGGGALPGGAPGVGGSPASGGEGGAPAPSGGGGDGGSPVCGDGQTATTEACDDGNAQGGDGCDQRCLIEEGWACSGSPSTCHELGSCGAPLPVTTDAYFWNIDDLEFNALPSYDAWGAGCISYGSQTFFFEVELEAGDLLHVTDHSTSVAQLNLRETCAADAPCVDTLDLLEVSDRDGYERRAGLNHRAAYPGPYVFSVESSGFPAPALLVQIDRCGDGSVPTWPQDPREPWDRRCDDGNFADGDGCSAGCEVEPGFRCEGEPSACAPMAGMSCVDAIPAEDERVYLIDGLAEFGNDLAPQDASCGPSNGPEIVFYLDLVAGQRVALSSGDSRVHVFVGACDPDGPCALSAFALAHPFSPVFIASQTARHYFAFEPMYDPDPVPGHPHQIALDVQTCGDGVRELYEECDDGGVADGDGCSAACVVEPGFVCLDGWCEPAPAATCAAPILVDSDDFHYRRAPIDGFATGADGPEVIFRVDGRAGHTIRVAASPLYTASIGPTCPPSYPGSDVVFPPLSEGPLYVAVRRPLDYVPTFEVAIHQYLCGDGTKSDAEECDDGNQTSGDGCSASCECEDATCLLGACDGVVVTSTASGLPKPLPESTTSDGTWVPLTTDAVGSVTKMALFTYVPEAPFALSSPAGTVARVYGALGDSSWLTPHHAFADDGWRDEAWNPDELQPYVTNVRRPLDRFTLFDGEPVTGTWTLHVEASSEAWAPLPGSVSFAEVAWCVEP